MRDDGIEIDQTKLDKIFERFHRIDKSRSRNTEGTGIGLSLVKSFVELHGGKINVEIEPGKGSIFKIELPANTVKNTEDTYQMN